MFSELIDKQIILKEINKDFDVSFDTVHNEYCISHKRILFRRVPRNEFTRELVTEIRRIVWLNENTNLIDEVEKNNEKIEQDNENKASDLYYQMAKDIRKPLIKEVYGI